MYTVRTKNVQCYSRGRSNRKYYKFGVESSLFVRCTACSTVQLLDNNSGVYCTSLSISMPIVRHALYIKVFVPKKSFGFCNKSRFFTVVFGADEDYRKISEIPPRFDLAYASTLPPSPSRVFQWSARLLVPR